MTVAAFVSADGLTKWLTEYADLLKNRITSVMRYEGPWQFPPFPPVLCTVRFALTITPPVRQRAVVGGQFDFCPVGAVLMSMQKGGQYTPVRPPAPFPWGYLVRKRLGTAEAASPEHYRTTIWEAACAVAAFSIRQGLLAVHDDKVVRVYVNDGGSMVVDETELKQTLCLLDRPAE